MNNRASFTAASSLPVKLLANADIVRQVIKHKIPPIHVQINPTNKCQRNCSFCSCSNRDRGLEINFDYLTSMIQIFVERGMKACTITGGGEPCLYPWINELLQFLYEHKVDVGITTNGIALNKIDRSLFDKLTWCRVSLSDEDLISDIDLAYMEKISIDWGLSYVVTKAFNFERLCEAIQFANQANLTHIRIVSDILCADSVEKMEVIAMKLKDKGIDDQLVIYQDRRHSILGHKRCLISLLKPNIGADGLIYPCCGVQFSEPIPSRDFGANFSMGNMENLVDIYEKQRFFDGSKCAICYYGKYNDALNILWDAKSVSHRNFI